MALTACVPGLHVALQPTDAYYSRFYYDNTLYIVSICTYYNNTLLIVSIMCISYVYGLPAASLPPAGPVH